MMMKISVLIENTTNKDLICEHGLSLFIEFAGKRYLLDAGQSGDFIKNADVMQVPIGKADCAILSHGHYDHGGGFGTYLKEYPYVKLYGMKGIIGEYYSGSGGSIHEIGVPQAVLQEHKEKILLVEGVTQIADCVYLVPHSTSGLETIGERTKLYQRIEDAYVPDAFAHELSLVFDTNRGLMIFNSCSHGGFCNIIREVKEVFPKRQFYGFCGGLHMKGTKDGKEYCTFTQEALQELTDCFQKEKISKLYTGHCTGKVGVSRLREWLGDHLEVLSTGMVIEL